MTAGVATGRPHEPAGRWRPWSLVTAALALLVALAPPLSTVARRADYAAALQFSLLAIAVPALVTVGAPWRLLHLSRRGSGGPAGRPFDRLADRRRRHPELARSLAFIGADLVAVVAWHAPPSVEAVARHGWPALLEALTLLVLGVGLWLELVHSPPLAPRSGHLRRAVLTALVMWVFWVLAYIMGLSNHAFYPNFHHVPGGLKAAADQQIASALSWFVAAVAFMPVIFWNAVMWLKTEDDPDTELIALDQGRPAAGHPTAHRERRLPALLSGTPAGQRGPAADVGTGGRSTGCSCVSRARSAACSCANALRRSAASWDPSLLRLRRAPALSGWLMRVWTSSIAPSASEVVHNMAVATIWPRCLPAGVPGTVIPERS